MSVPIPYRTDRTLDSRFTDAEWERKLPEIKWRDPAPITSTDGARGYACRFCLARYGIYGSKIAQLPKTRAEHEAHMTQYHPIKP